MRIGQGFDVHALVEGRPLLLGGVEVPYERGLAGHSDGDVLLHAIIDALLGAAALGDIGGMFPDADECWAGARSLDLLAGAYGRVRAAGYVVRNVDSTVVCEAPRLAAHIGAMQERIAGVLEIDITLVGVKATTTDGLGFTGEGAGIAALAVVLLQ
jgi:2-C-methyl-D-erythritol 2,4-cyclodiphosphate synthase